EKMGVANILRREHEIVALAIKGLRKIRGVHILADNVENRLGVLSFYHESIHFNLIVKLLSDRFGIQVRGGCVCAGTYGHYLLEVSYERSREITEKINHGDLSEKPGWVRWSLHPTSTDEEVLYFLESLETIITNISDWKKDYEYRKETNEYMHKDHMSGPSEKHLDWFKL
ncbi:aminotransferase class V-fold PLP-dependent enzyme, partial [Bacteroidota bacterium]